MNVRNFSLVLALVVFSSSSLFGQTFFWSDIGFGGGAVNNESFATTVNTNTSNTLFLYYAAEGVDIGTAGGGGLDFNFGWSADGVASFTAAETFDFMVTIPAAGIDLGPRWGDSAGAANDVTANDVDGFFALTVVNGQGLGAGNDGSGAILDLGFDASAGAFLIGSIDYDAGPAFGSTVLDLEFEQIVSDGIGIPANGFTANITVGVPEPTSAAFLALGLVGLVTRRRR